MSNATMRSPTDYEPTPVGLAERWEQELDSADKAVEHWHERAKKIEDRYQDERASDKGGKKLNLFHSDVETTKAIVYDNDPKVHCRRRYADADDDVARVSAEIIERHLNADIEREDDGFCTALGMARDDRVIVGFGALRFRYVVEWGKPIPAQPAQIDPATGQEIAPAVPERKVKAFEDAECDHLVWEDVRWSPCRNRNEVRWFAFGAELTIDEAKKRFPDVDVEKLPVASRREDVSDENRDNWARIKVWEIWDKATRTVYWHVRGHNEILDSKPDPLGLPGFFPCPLPMMANATNRKYMPVPDFAVAQDLYDEIDKLTDRIATLVDYARVVGACDKGNEALGQVLNQAKEGHIIPVENFGALFGQGVDRGVWMFPLEPLIGAVNALVAKRQESIQQLYQVTGTSDIMRGGGQTKTATQARMEGRFGASRVRSRQKELARFAQEAQRIRAQIIAKWFDAETIIKRSNIEAAEMVEMPSTPPQPAVPGMPPQQPAPPKKVPNRQLIDQAVALIKSDISAYRIEIAEDSLAMTDYDAVKQERTELITALGGFFAAMAPMMADPQQRPYVIRLAQFVVAGLRGASQAEAILDEAVRAAEKAAAIPQQPAPNPKLQEIQAKTQADTQRHAAEAKIDVQAHAATRRIDVEAERANQAAQAEFAVPRMRPPGGPNGDL